MPVNIERGKSFFLGTKRDLQYIALKCVHRPSSDDWGRSGQLGVPRARRLAPSRSSYVRNARAAIETLTSLLSELASGTEY